MTSLPPALLEQLLGELSTLASVYHKPPESFVGQGRFGADEIQRAAIQEQRQNAAENPIAASVAGAARGGGGAAGGAGNIENLLDIDFDGAAPASTSQDTPDRGPSPAAGAAAGGGGGSMADMMGLFDAGPAAPPGGAPAGGMGDMMNGFASLDLMGSSTQPPPAAQQLQQGFGGAPAGQKKDSDDLLGLF